MRIIAYSKIPATTPFVHLGYLAAASRNSYAARSGPGFLFAGLLFAAFILLTAGISLLCAGNLQRTKPSSGPLPLARIRKFPRTLVGLAAFLLGVIGMFCVYVFA